MLPASPQRACGLPECAACPAWALSKYRSSTKGTAHQQNPNPPTDLAHRSCACLPSPPRGLERGHLLCFHKEARNFPLEAEPTITTLGSVLGDFRLGELPMPLLSFLQNIQRRCWCSPHSFYPRRNGSSERERAPGHRSSERSDFTVVSRNRRHKDTNGEETFPQGMSSPEPCFLEAASLGPEGRNPRNQSNAYMTLAKQMLLEKVGGRGERVLRPVKNYFQKRKEARILQTTNW